MERVSRAYHTLRKRGGLVAVEAVCLPSLYRQAQFSRVELYERDITMLLRDYRPDMASIFEELAPYVSETDASEIESIVSDIESRIAKAEQRFRER